jgi:hypothetical protein
MDGDEKRWEGQRMGEGGTGEPGGRRLRTARVGRTEDGMVRRRSRGAYVHGEFI